MLSVISNLSKIKLKKYLLKYLYCYITFVLGKIFIYDYAMSVVQKGG